MNNLDLHEEFVNALHDRIPKHSDLVNSIADILLIEKDAAYRRLSGKVNFTVREVGLISRKLNISIDHITHRDDSYVWLPFILEHPMKVRSIDDMLDVADLCIEQINKTIAEPTETGNIYSSLPMEFYLYSPVLTKFMFFKWGHYFVGTEEFDNYSEWELPERTHNLCESLTDVFNFDKNYYIWDQSLIWSLAKEISNMHKMHVITTEEKKEIVLSLKDMLNKLEQTLSGAYTPTVGIAREAAFYVSSMSLGFTSNYFLSESSHFFTFQTYYSFCVVDENHDSFYRMKDWVDSFRNISNLLSRSGRIERRLFFEEQHKILDRISE